MNSVVLKGPRHIDIVQKPIPTRKQNEVLIKVERIGICGSDYHSFRGSNPFVSYPYTPGHEASGTVVEASKESNFRKGDKVVVDPVIACGSCYPCSIGRPNVCENLQVIGASINGLMQEYATVPERNVYRAPAELSFDSLVFTEPLSIGAQAHFRSKINKGEKTAIIGGGTIGMAALLFSKWESNTKSAIIEIDPNRRIIAKTMGAAVTLDPSAKDFKNRFRDFAGREGVPVVIEAVGSEKSIELALDLVLPAGRVVIQGIVGKKILVKTDVLIEKELDVLGSRMSSKLFPQVLKHIARHGDELLSLPVKKYPLSAAEDAFLYLEKNNSSILKVILTTENE